MFEPIEPESLWSFTDSKEDIEKCPRRRVVRNFCFPEGVKVAQVVSMDQLQSVILQQFGMSNVRRASDSAENTISGVFDQIKQPFVYLFNLNKKEEPKKKKKKKQ